MNQKELEIIKDYGRWVNSAVIYAHHRELKKLKQMRKNRNEMRKKLFELGLDEWYVNHMVDNLISILIHFVGYEPFKLKTLYNSPEYDD